VAETPRATAFCTIVAGPNGSGKSTIYPQLSLEGEFVNADIVARRINPAHPESVSMAAGRLVLKTIDEILNDRRSFVYETTLSSRQSLAVMERCKEMGYEVALVYVVLDSPELNVLRVAERVSRGGHDIPADVIRRRYETAFGRLPHALRLADNSLMFDNSGREPRMLLTLERGEIVENHLDEAMPLHVRLAEALAEALDVGTDAVFQAARYT
jgi:predicted ABC-type ATPase